MIIKTVFSHSAFFYSAYIELQWQLLIVVIFDILGTMACVKVELDSRWRQFAGRVILSTLVSGRSSHLNSISQITLATESYQREDGVS